MTVFQVYTIDKTTAHVDDSMVFSTEKSAIKRANYLADSLVDNGYSLEECYDGEQLHFNGTETFKVLVKGENTINERIVEIFIEQHHVFETL